MKHAQHELAQLTAMESAVDVKECDEKIIIAVNTWKSLVQFASKAHNNLKKFGTETAARRRLERENQEEAEKRAVQPRQEQGKRQKLADMMVMQMIELFNDIFQFPRRGVRQGDLH